MVSLQDIIFTDNAIDPSKIAAWIGCIGVVYSGAMRTVSYARRLIVRPKIAPPSIGCQESIKHPRTHVCITLENTGRVPVDVDQVRLKCLMNDGTKCTWQLDSDEDGPIPAKRGIDKDSISPPWRRAYLLLCDDAHIETNMLERLIQAEPASFILEVWVRGSDRPLWCGSGAKISSLHAALHACLERGRQSQAHLA